MRKYVNAIVTVNYPESSSYLSYYVDLNLDDEHTLTNLRVDWESKRILRFDVGTDTKGNLAEDEDSVYRIVPMFIPSEYILRIRGIS